MWLEGLILGPVFAHLACKLPKKREFLLAGTGTLELAVRKTVLVARRPTAVQHLSVLSMLELNSAISDRQKISLEG